MADTALRTSGSGYLTRRLIDVTQDVIILQEDCGTANGTWIIEPKEKGMLPPLVDRILGRWTAHNVVHPQTGEIIVDNNEEIDEIKAKAIGEAVLPRYLYALLLPVSPLTVCAAAATGVILVVFVW